MKSYTLKIRGGVEVDSGGKKAGKGALIQEEKSATLGVSQDQILFQAVKSIGFMRGLGGVQTMSEKMPTLQAANGMSGNNKPCVAYGVTTKGNGDAFVSEERHTSLSTGGGEPGQGYPCVMTAVGVDMYNQELTGDKQATLGVNCGLSTGRNGVITFGMGGNNQPVICLQGNGIDRADTARCNGKGWTEDVSYTLNTIDRPAVVYTVDEKMGQTYIHEDQANTLAARDFKQPQTVVYPEMRGGAHIQSVRSVQQTTSFRNNSR